MPPEERLRGEEGGCAKGGGLAQPAPGKCIKSPDARQEGKKVEQVTQVGEIPGNKELERARTETDEHNVGRAVVVVGVTKLRHLTSGRPGSVSLQRQIGVFVEF